MFEPVNPGWSTPSWGEFGAWRVHGRHQGLDYYVPRNTPVFASGDGIVEVVAFHAGGHGHFCDTRYGEYRVRVSHFLNRPSVEPGQSVTARTRFGTAGQSGNAEGITWNGLIHPHVEVRRVSNNLLQNPRTVLAPLDRSSLAGGGGTPINPGDDDMFTDADRALLNRSRPIRELVRTPDGTIWYCYERLIRYAIPSERNLNTYRAHLANLGYDNNVQEKSAVDIQAYGAPVFSDGIARTASSVDARLAPRFTAIPGGTGGAAVDLAPVLDAIANVPTAEQNGQAARNAIVK